MKPIRAIVTATLVLGAAACSGEAADVPPVCESYDAVQNTVEHVRTTNVSENGLTALQPYVSQLREQLDQLYRDAQAQFAPQTAALRSSVDQLTATVTSAKADPDVASLASVRTSVANLRTNARNLRDAMASTC